MKASSRCLSAALLCLSAAALHAGGENSKNPAALEERSAPLSYEFDLEESYVGDADVRREGISRTLDEHTSAARFVFTPRTSFGIFRIGAEYDRYSFGLDQNSPVPNTLQSVSLVLGIDKRFGDSIVVRAEVQPGLYGASFDHISTGTFNVPFVVGGTYIFSPDFQLILGVGVDLNRKFPVLPTVGARWKFAPHLVASIVLPAPRVEYEVNRTLTAYVGAELKGGSYRVDADFGGEHGDDRLNRAVVTFSEVRVGGGVDWKITPKLTLSGAAGAQVAREFDFFRANDRYRSDGVAPYGTLSLHGAF